MESFKYHKTESSKSKCKCAIDNRLLVSILIMIAFTISETIAVIAQPNQSNKNNTILYAAKYN